ALLQSLSVECPHSGDFYLSDIAGGLSDGLWHGACAGNDPSDAPDAGDPAVLDVVSDPRLCLDRDFEAGRPAQPVSDVAQYHRYAAQHSQYRYGHLHWYRLFLSAIHGSADLFLAGKDGLFAYRSGAGSRLHTVCGLLENHVPAVAGWRAGWLLPRVHSGCGRIRDPGSSRRVADPDDRQDDLER